MFVQQFSNIEGSLCAYSQNCHIGAISSNLEECLCNSLFLLIVLLQIKSRFRCEPVANPAQRPVLLRGFRRNLEKAESLLHDASKRRRNLTISNTCSSPTQEGYRRHVKKVDDDLSGAGGRGGTRKSTSEFAEVDCWVCWWRRGLSWLRWGEWVDSVRFFCYVSDMNWVDSVLWTRCWKMTQLTRS